MKRTCPSCRDDSLPATAIRCPSCGHELPESHNVRSDPDAPACGLCGAAIALMAETCPSCGADGYPALRARQGRTSQGTPDELKA